MPPRIASLHALRLQTTISRADTALPCLNHSDQKPACSITDLQLSTSLASHPGFKPESRSRCHVLS